MIATGNQASPDIEILEHKIDETINNVATLEESPATTTTIYDEAFLSNFDAAKYPYDYSSTSTAFNFPSCHEYPAFQPSERYSAQHLPADHPTFKQEISKIFCAHLFRTKLTENIKFIDGTRVNNSKMHDNLMLCRNMLASSGQNCDFTYLFLLSPGYDPIYEDHVFAYGPKCGNLPAEFLGDPSTGVVLSSHPDTCTLTPLIPFVPYRIIIFKALLGITKSMAINSKTYPRSDIPEESFGANIAFNEHGAETLYDIFTQSLVYIYDRKDSASFYMYPRTLYPYAAATFYIDIPYHPTKLIRLPWYSQNIICKTTFNYDPVFRIPASIYQIFDSNNRISELGIDGITVRKMISFSDLGRWAVLRELFSGAHGDLYDFNEIHIQSSNLSADYFISHCILSSDDPRFLKIVRGMIIPQVGALFSVPYISKLNTADANGGKSCGILLPNSTFVTLFGVPIIPGDILHCFFIHRVVVASTSHPIRTLKRERMLISMSKNQRISRSDKISDNDIRVALSQTIAQQIMTVDYVIEGCTSFEEKERYRAQILKQLHLYDEPPYTQEQCEHGQQDEENEYQQFCKKRLFPKSFYPVRSSHSEDVQNIRYERLPVTVEQMEVDSPPISSSASVSSLPSPSTFKTAVILDPRIILDTQIDPNILETMLRLTTECTKNGILSKFTVIYHQCMKSTRITDNLNSHPVDPQRVTQYHQLEESYANLQTIQFAPEHTCDSKRTALRAAVVCILTILRKYNFNNAVLLTYSAVTDEAVFFQQHKTCLMTPEEYIEKLKRRDTSFLF